MPFDLTSSFSRANGQLCHNKIEVNNTKTDRLNGCLEPQGEVLVDAAIDTLHLLENRQKGGGTGRLTLVSYQAGPVLQTAIFPVVDGKAVHPDEFEQMRSKGAIQAKGFYILGGLLPHLLQTDHPLAFDASIAFEQSYAGIDSDSASLEARPAVC